MRHVLEIPGAFDIRADWNGMLTMSLLQSGLFDVRIGEFPEVPRRRRFLKNLSFLRLDSYLLAIDTWDGEAPSTSGRSFLDDVDLILKIEYRPAPIWEEVGRRHSLAVSAWTMFGYADFPTECFRWCDHGHRFLYAFSGDQKRSKRPWLRYMRRRGAPVFGIQAVSDYTALLRQVRWGVILQGNRGANCDGKNRREHAFTSVGLPLALNYQPYYPFLMRPGVDYVYLERPEDLNALASIDPRPFAEASRRLWSERFSPQGAARTLLEICSRNLPKAPKRSSR